MSWVNEYRETIRYLSKVEVIAERRELFGIINGDAFFPLSSWPIDLRLAFWKKPIGDRETSLNLCYFAWAMVAPRP